MLIVVLVNVLSPLFCRKPDETYVESLRKTEFTSETAGVERICCIDDNEEALLWRLRMIGTAKESIVLSTFDLRADDNGTDSVHQKDGYTLIYNSTIGGVYMLYREANDAEIEWYNNN